MVRGNLDKTAQNREQNHRAEPQNRSQPPVEPLGPERPQSSDNAEPENQQPEEKQPDLLHCDRLLTQQHSEEESEVRPELVCNQAVALTGFESWPTHFRHFSSTAEYDLVKRTHLQLQHSGFYWGPMTMETAHDILTHTPGGTFLVRDSGQLDVFFTLSYKGEDGPTSIRVLLTKQLFSLNGSHKTFVSFFALLRFYTGCSCKLKKPHRKQRPELLKQMCRRAVIHTYGADSIHTLLGLSTEVKDYLYAYPYCI